jgi:hypothetical protein
MNAGDVYLGIDIFTREEVAVKVEPIDQDSELEAEYEIYEKLKNCQAVPKVRWFGTESTYNVLVVDLLGPSLEDLLNQHGRSFSLKTVVLLAEQLVSVIIMIFPDFTANYVRNLDHLRGVYSSRRDRAARHKT